MTSKEFLTSTANEQSYETWYEFNYDTHEEYQEEITIEMMNQYAKMRVQEAVDAIVDNARAEIEYYDELIFVVGHESIRSAYDLNNIK